MARLDIAQQIKIIKEANMTLRVNIVPTEGYDINKPSRYDRHVESTTLRVNNTLSYLLSTINYLSKEILLLSSDGKVIPKELWQNLKEIRDMIKSQNHAQK